ncbi:MAG: glycosyltransferase family 2 protein [Candidatus Shapirobacteria bacterium]|nr:glycosyltransferase family 2 protein [Candidatus Shapirobacteria bacterium]
MSRIKLTIIIVTYNSEKELLKLIQSLKLIENIVSKIIIIDNNSKRFDKNIQKYNQKIKIIENHKNLGFAKAVNQGIKITKTNFILLLNPDTYLIDNSITKSFNLIKKNSNIGVVGGKIKYPNNVPYLTANSKPTFLIGIFEFTTLKKIFPNNKFTKQFWVEKNKKIKKPMETSSLCGAYLIFRKKINKQLNLFNENYFMYMEDIDFGIKNNKSGYKVIFDPNSQIIHIGGASSHNKYHTSLNHWYKSRKIFFKKHLNLIQGTILDIIFSIEEKILKTRQLILHEKNN